MIVQQFLEWMENAPVSRRADATSALVRTWLYADLEIGVRDEAEAALTLILDDPSPIVRLALAEALANSPDAPHHIIITLAADQVDIAGRVLRASPVFLDAELVDLSATLDASVQEAIAERPVVSASVAAALSEVGCEATILKLCANEGARIADFSLRRIIERFGERAAVRELLVSRRDLPVELRQMLIARLSETLSKLAVGRSWMGAERAELVTREARDRATVNLAKDVDARGMFSLVEHLKTSGQLTTALLLRAICAGNLAFFEAAVANLADMPHARVGALVESGRLANFRAIYARAKLPDNALEAFLAAVEVYRELSQDGSTASRKRFAQVLIGRVLERYQDGLDDELDHLLVMLRRLAADSARDAARELVQNGRQKVIAA